MALSLAIFTLTIGFIGFVLSDRFPVELEEKPKASHSEPMSSIFRDSYFIKIFFISIFTSSLFLTSLSISFLWHRSPTWRRPLD